MVLRHVAPFFYALFVLYIIKHLFREYACSVNFEYKNDLTIIINLPAGRSSLQKFDNDCEVIFIFNM